METEETMENNGTDLDFNFESALEDYLSTDFGDLEEGTIVKGEIVRIDDDNVLVDVNFKSEGQIPTIEFQNTDGNITAKVGDKIDVFVVRKNEQEGTIILSFEKAKRMQLFDQLEDLQEKNGIIKGRIVRRIKGGYTIDLRGVEAFLPGSHVDLRPVPDMDMLVNQEYEFRVLKINRRRSNVIVSRRVLLEEERDSKRQDLLQTISEGQVVVGKVKNVTEYGVFVDLGGLDGLLHITDMSWKRIRHPREMVNLGQELELKVLSFDKENQKVSLGLKQLVPDPWQDITERFPETSHHVGKVTNLVDYGVFVELESGVEGLVHISEMSWTRKLRHPSQMVHQGDEVEVVILGIDQDKKRISLGMKQVKPNPWELVGEKYPEGTILEGVVKNITEFGMFIGIEDGIDGLIHVSDISWTKKVRHPNELFKVGDTVQAKVLTVDQENEKFTLGIKQLTEDPWSNAPSVYPVGGIVKGIITNITDFGLFVEVEEGIEGLVHVSELSSKKIKSPSEIYKDGEEIQAKIIHVSAEERRLGLSIKQLKEDEEHRKSREYSRTGPDSGQSLGDLLKMKLEEPTEN
ncbi:30S ribosomal protein S1 [Lawsonia intracellularis]|uniref:Small ribosomal subunit protein bS1 n=1 Tax=Lawsonia intracellularis (strain PHE/MN1-00) TaxID=363253 RepID=Q1MQB8_LAWIP|nr:30S ribosomal protein S1 [Lawsonia intracellularis]AGC50176.1 30S ribosomal protein S1 [Lawsonia intracellularis N343]KAA0204872.1 30S ribosomal protein S1 [Lawsonia intracellularis]MBZ3892617.1 30S ribosomal protein S1 [Lawsonia intracellularis]OMQ03158.1 30S ribosomal protein S1 [Lawsonia intracellularis]RBN33214.1 30S ribosomal protein S1 [Lawsonia intracellularis]